MQNSGAELMHCFAAPLAPIVTAASGQPAPLAFCADASARPHFAAAKKAFERGSDAPVPVIASATNDLREPAQGYFPHRADDCFIVTCWSHPPSEIEQ